MISVLQRDLTTSMSACRPDDSTFVEKDDEFGTWQSPSILKDCKWVCDSYKVVKGPEQKIYQRKLSDEEKDPFRWDSHIKLVQAGLLRRFCAEFPPLKPLPRGIVPVISHNCFDRSITCDYVRESSAQSLYDCLQVAGEENYGFGWAYDQFDPPIHLISYFTMNRTFCTLFAVDPIEEKKTGKTDKRCAVWRQKFDPDLPFPARAIEQLRTDMEGELNCRVTMLWEDMRIACYHCERVTDCNIIEHDGEYYCHEDCLPLHARQRAHDEYDINHPFVQSAIREKRIVTHRGVPV